MADNLLIRLLRWLVQEKEQPPPAPPPAPSRPPLVVAMGKYQQALDALSDDFPTLLPVLLARDSVEAVRQKALSPPVDHAQRLIALDRQLTKQVEHLALKDLAVWRQTFAPSQGHWWWFLDQGLAEREEEKDLIWVLLTGTLTMVTLALATDIVRRLWDGAPDTLSVLGTLVTLVLTGSPLIKRGRELVQAFLNKIPRLKPRFQAEVMTAMAFVALALVVVGRFVLMPQLARQYNNWGYDAVHAGNLNAAEGHFRRAVALDADLSVGYYHLANVYEEIAQPDEAIAWYQKAIEHDLGLGAAYNNLGRLYILQGNAERAVQILYAGLSNTGSETELEIVTTYRLLSNLGWAYHVLDQPVQAREVLEEAIALENQLDVAYRSAAPHYYLAWAYESLDQPDKAIVQLEDSLRYLEKGNPDQISWEETVRSRLDDLRKEE
jgi:Tfp pilus assembly protein PilF